MNTKQQTGIWVFVAVVLALVVGVLAYFTLIGPELDRAATAREDLEFTQSENELLEMQIAQMQALEDEVPGWTEEIAKISLDLPPRTEIAELERLFAAELEAAGLPLVGMTTGLPALIDPLAVAGFEPPTVEPLTPEAEPTPTPEPAAEGEDDDTSTDGTTGGTAGGTPAPATPEAPFTGLMGMPVTIITEGDPEDVLTFIKSMEGQLTRFYTVTNLTISRATETDASPGRPQLTENQWQFQVSGLVFSLLDANRSFVPDETDDLREYQPGLGVENAFAPLPGTE